MRVVMSVSPGPPPRISEALPLRPGQPEIGILWPGFASRQAPVGFALPARERERKKRRESIAGPTNRQAPIASDGLGGGSPARAGWTRNAAPAAGPGRFSRGEPGPAAERAPKLHHGPICVDRARDNPYTGHHPAHQSPCFQGGPRPWRRRPLSHPCPPPHPPCHKAGHIILAYERPRGRPEPGRGSRPGRRGGGGTALSAAHRRPVRSLPARGPG